MSEIKWSQGWEVRLTESGADVADEQTVRKAMAELFEVESYDEPIEKVNDGAWIVALPLAVSTALRDEGWLERQHGEFFLTAEFPLA